MQNNFQSQNKIPIPQPKRFLAKEEFQEYLELVKIIANFDPETKRWYLNQRKLEITNKDVIKETIMKLKDYVGDEILNILSDYLKDNNNTIHAEFKGNYITIFDDLEKYKDVLTYYIRTFDHVSGQYQETPILLAWQRPNGFSTLRGLYWKLNNLVNFRVKPFANLSFTILL